MNKPVFKKRLICDAPANSPWAGKMVLNPAMIIDPEEPRTLHMLFRACGAWPEAQIAGKPLPYPIFVGYATSADGGENWDFDFSRPALAPALKQAAEEINVVNAAGERVFNFANGCIEDPRLFFFENNLYLTVACRTFPPGPYWDHDEPTQCQPDWVAHSNLIDAVKRNDTISILYRVSLEKLKNRDYENAFTFVAPLHDLSMGDDRDVMLFPRRLNIHGKKKIVCIHRPKYPWNYPFARELTAPSIFLSAADNLEDFASPDKAERVVFATPEYEWEQNRIAVSFTPIEIAPGEWVVPYHGKQDDKVGYTQSFMLVRENGTLNPEILARPSERLLYADQPWELEGDFTIPCVFTCSGVIMQNGELLMGYGAADERIGLASTDFAYLVSYLKQMSK